MKNTNKKQFPQLLYAMLESADLQGDTGCSNAVTWLPHGYAFKILDQREFIEVAVPMFFKQTKIRSFYRQLNLWGYKRVSSGTDVGAYYNKHFLRGSPEKTKEMIRVKIKGRVPRNDSKQQDPDFYGMPPLPGSTKSGTEGQSRKRITHRKGTNAPCSGGPTPCPNDLMGMPAVQSGCYDSLRGLDLQLLCTNSSFHGGAQVQSMNCDNLKHPRAINDPILEPTLSSLGGHASSPSFGLGVPMWTMPTVRPRLPNLSTAASKRVSFDNKVEDDRLSGDNLEPLQFDKVHLDYGKLPFDEFAKYIDTAIQRL